MTSEEFVKKRYPKARVRHFHTNDVFDKKGYWLCWADSSGKLRLSEGTSENNAWANAKKRIKDDESDF